MTRNCSLTTDFEFFPAMFDRGYILLPNTNTIGSRCSFVDGMSVLPEEPESK